ncbi:unnamed protein product [Arabis nemorensis]|uniref:Uncharacterized protein n=1 Tax=Arabis nemorensis TaxID=586526 RepID=A0A565BEZ2_9BRAS|nr:unnamed protein product [Arabis nemorensis]
MVKGPALTKTNMKIPSSSPTRPENKRVQQKFTRNVSVVGLALMKTGTFTAMYAVMIESPWTLRS